MSIGLPKFQPQNAANIRLEGEIDEISLKFLPLFPRFGIDWLNDDVGRLRLLVFPIMISLVRVLVKEGLIDGEVEVLIKHGTFFSDSLLY